MDSVGGICMTIHRELIQRNVLHTRHFLSNRRPLIFLIYFIHFCDCSTAHTFFILNANGQYLKLCLTAVTLTLAMLNNLRRHAYFLLPANQIP